MSVPTLFNVTVSLIVSVALVGIGVWGLCSLVAGICRSPARHCLLGAGQCPSRELCDSVNCCRAEYRTLRPASRINGGPDGR